MTYLITTDTSCDVPRRELKAQGIPYIPLTYTIDDAVMPDEFSLDEEYAAFYQRLRGGAMPTTSQISSYLHEEFFSGLYRQGSRAILHLSLSGGLSNTYNSAVVGAESAMENCPGLKIRVVDTLSATQAHRALLDKALELRNKNIDMELAADTLDKLKNNLQVWIFVDDLMHLKRGGRVSGAAAYVGTLLKIKPVLIIDNLGKLTVNFKANGWKKAISYGVDMLEKHCGNVDKAKIYLASADAGDRVQEFMNAIEERGYRPEIVTGWIGPIIGSHTGAGTMGMVFFGDARLTSRS